MPSHSTSELYPLGDAYQDGGIEECAWVPIALAASPETALQVLEASGWHDTVISLRHDGHRLVADGTRSWHRVAPCIECDEGVERRGVRFDEDDVVRSVIGPMPSCEVCHGTTEQVDQGEGVAWEPCEPTADGAVEFWNVEVTDA